MYTQLKLYYMLKLRNGTLENYKESDKIFEDDERLYAHLQDIIHLEVTGYSYVDFVNCLDGRKFISRFVFMLTRGAIS